jgi:Mn2+/Fe2+ NRAMP family transporter
LSTLCRKGYSKKYYLSLWIMAEIAIIGADMQVKYIQKIIYIEKFSNF